MLVLISISPSVGTVIIENTFSNVDLPAPLCPIIPILSPLLTLKLTSLSAQNSPLFFLLLNPFLNEFNNTDTKVSCLSCSFINSYFLPILVTLITCSAIILAFIIALGFGLFFATMNVKYRDIINAKKTNTGNNKILIGGIYLNIAIITINTPKDIKKSTACTSLELTFEFV